MNLYLEVCRSICISVSPSVHQSVGGWVGAARVDICKMQNVGRTNRGGHLQDTRPTDGISETCMARHAWRGSAGDFLCMAGLLECGGAGVGRTARGGSTVVSNMDARRLQFACW